MIPAFPKIFTIGIKYIKDILRKDIKLTNDINKTDLMEWGAHIKRVSNGFILTLSFFGEDDEKDDMLVFEDKDNSDNGGIHSFIDMCWELVEHFDLSGSRYDKERIYITLRRGDKYEKRG